MAGHNKWSKVKNVKGPADAKRGKLFTKLIKEITISARMGGGNADGNPRLRSAILAAKAASMPKENIERALKKGTGELQDGGIIEEVTYEGYAPGGIAVLIETTTDNKNRTVSDLRNLLKANGGHLAESGSVNYLFDRVGQLLFDATKHAEDTIMEVALESGAQDVSSGDGFVEVTTSIADVYKVKDTFDRVGMHPNSAGLAWIPKSTIKIESKDVGAKILHLLEVIEDHDDVQKVHANFDMDDSLLAQISGH